MWQKGDGIFCHGIEGEKEKEEDDDSDYEDNYDHGDDWDPEELLVDSEGEDSNNDNNNNNNNNNMEEDDNGYTASERAYMNAISILEDDVEMVEEEQQEQEQEQEQDPEQEQEEDKDERYYLREEKALENLAVINKFRLYINEAQSMQQQARIAVGQAKEDTEKKMPVEHMHIVAMVDFCQNVQLPPHKMDQPGKTYSFVPLNIFVLGVVDCNSKKDHLHAYMYTEAEGGKGGNLVASMIMKYLFDRGLLDGQQRYKLIIVMENCSGQNKNKMVI